MQEWKRTHTCGRLREADIGCTVVLNGWANAYRDQGSLLFIDLRDRYGVTQVVFESECPELLKVARDLRNENEYVVAIKGQVARRLDGKDNADLSTGTIEVKAESLQVLNRSLSPPFDVTEFPGQELANEELRMEYRYLDLRRSSLQRTLSLRHQVNKVIRGFLDERGFLEIETPLLGRSMPEGARDYVVPSRLSHGCWYALPQSPQLYKQLLMVAGYDKYYQIARCLRDEDLRANRQPEFTQLDLEMSFVERDDVLNVIEGLAAEVFGRCIDVTIPLPLPRLSYVDAMLRFGCDKPDLRYGMEIVDIGDLAAQAEFKVFRDALASGGKVRGLNAKAAAERLSRKAIEQLTQHVQTFHAKGLAWFKVESDKLVSPIEKFFPAAVQQALRQRLQAEPGDLLFFVADSEDIVCQSLCNLRTQLATTLELYDPSKPDYKLAWVVDFPMFTWDKEDNRWAANHHPFTAPRDEDLSRLETDPAAVQAQAYDLVINGDECGGGSIRIHDPDVQSRVFSMLGMTMEQAQQRFGFLLDALIYGAPPHGGIALGFDRWIMTLARTNVIRDVIAFPKNQKARDLMTGAPAPLDPKQLRELGRR